MRTRFAAGCVASVVLWTGSALAGNILTNGGFETGDFTGWTTTLQTPSVCSGPSTVCGLNLVFLSAQEGSSYAVDGPANEEDTISQTFSDTAGVSYRLSAWVASDGPCVLVVVCRTAEFSLNINSTPFASESSAILQGWTQYTTTFVGSGFDTFAFTNRNDEDYNYLDNVSVVAVPEPSAWATMLLGFGLAGFGLRARSRRLLLSAT